MHSVETKVVERIYTLDIDNEDMNTRLVERIDTTGDENNFLSNVKALTTGTFHSKELEYPEIKTLCEIISKFAVECAEKENMYQSPNHLRRSQMSNWYNAYIKHLKVTAIWGTRYEKEQITIPHNHWPARWAFTYYIDPPENAQGLWITDAGVEIPIKHGRLLLFKGNVIHETKPVRLKGYRYCIAGTVD